ncbi:hypothetical protein LSM04_005539 [Trypanosoma melophagium]|uniref:uncharacterized protein n=1 Tax=Trypanosoma melophagium TaxID=715481 RepID=UPI00351A27FC|nr:hypothetical protein LSM04_005539 [Trypanosoma melophagium]
MSSREYTARFTLRPTPHRSDLNRAVSWAPHERDHINYETLGPRVSEMLQPQSVKDLGLQRALHRPKKRRNHRSRSVGGDNQRTGEFPEWQKEQQQQQQQQVDSRFTLRQYERNNSGEVYHHYYDNNNNQNNVYNGEYRGFDYNMQSHREEIHSSKPIVDVVAAFGRTRNTENHPITSASSINTTTTMDPKRTSGNTDIKTPPLSSRGNMKPHEPGRSADRKQLTPQTSPPRVEIEKASNVVDYHWSPMHGTTSFSAIRPSIESNMNMNNSNSGGTGQYTSPSAVAERIIHALLQQHEEQMTKLSLSPSSALAATPVGMVNMQNKLLRKQKNLERERGLIMGEKSGIDNNSTGRAGVSALQHHPILRVTPQETQLVRDIIRTKDREILQLRTSLALSYRYAAYAIQGHRFQGTSGLSSSSPSMMESRYLDALASAVQGSKKDSSSMLLVNKVPPHVHGLPDIPFPLGLSSSVGRVCGVLSMMNVEDMLQKKTPTHVFSRSWRFYFVVADDRGLSIYRNEEDYEQHAFQRALLIVPFRDMVYFVPSFRALPMNEEELFDTAELKDFSLSQTRETNDNGNTNSSSNFFLSLISKRRRHKNKNKNEENKTDGGGDISEEYNSNATTGSRDNTDDYGNNKQLQQRSRRRHLDQYEKLMASIAIEHAGDASYAYFGFIARQPSTHVGSKVVNPPIIFRTRSVQEHAEWVHYFAQCFNRRLYREMFPTVLAESYAGTDTKETQTEIEIETTTPTVKEEEKEKEEINSLVATNKVVTVSSIDAETQTSPDCGINVAINTEEEKEERNMKGVSLFYESTPPPPDGSPPKWSVVDHDVRQALINTIDEASQTNENGSLNTSIVAKEKENVVKEEVLPWKELITEMRGLLASKNEELSALQHDYDELHQHVQQLEQELRQITNDRDELKEQVKEDHAKWEAEAAQLRKTQKSLDAATEAARLAEMAMQEASVREETQMAYNKSLQEEVAQLRQGQDLLTAELLAVKNGYSAGLRSLAKKALGDIDQLHDVYTAEKYLRALRGESYNNSNSSASVSEEYRSSQEEEEYYNTIHDEKRPNRQMQLPLSPPPLTSMRQTKVSPPRIQEKEKKRQGISSGIQHKIPKGVKKNRKDAFIKKTSDTMASNEMTAVGIAMLLFSFTPQHMAIDGCFTVDEVQARLLRSGPSITQRGREWLMLHHDTGAILAVTAELQMGEHTTHHTNTNTIPMHKSTPTSKLYGGETERETGGMSASRMAPITTPPRKAFVRRSSPMTSPAVHFSSSRQLRDQLTSATATATAAVVAGVSSTGKRRRKSVMH